MDHAPARNQDTMTRRLDDGREFTIPKIYYEPEELEAALLVAGFATATVGTTARFFLLGQARAAMSPAEFPIGLQATGGQPKGVG